MEKDKDLFLDMLANPNLTLEDMVSVGHSAESTRFLDKSAYQNSQKVRAKFTDAEGNFKQDEFDNWYNTAAKAYQQLTDKDTNLGLLNVTSFDESDITVSPEKRTLNTKPIVSFTPNPDRLSTGIYRIGRTSERERTQSELAQAEKILLNPVEAAKDPSKAKWGDSPNDSWWGNFFDTQVLAQWDEDGEHVDPVTKQTVQHKKGELKLNDNGTYYYEALDGRDVYGRQVLNKMDTITTDGSFWNQYDFFDSDDIKEKSFVGSVAKNLALVGSMFIPYVGWGVAGASVATQLVGLTGTLGKMLTGSDSPTFSAMEGWSKSLNRQNSKSEYAQQNMLCWENFIDLIGDTTAQLREQRAIFKFVPAILGKGKYGMETKAFGANLNTLKEETMTSLRKEANPNLNIGKMMRAVGGENPKESFERAMSTKENIISQIADKAVKDYFKDYNSVGEKVARAYMVGITVGDTYGEAKDAGASDFEATMLTLGYAAAENKLLNTELGKWIFPELKGERATMSQVAKKLLQPSEKLTAEGVESSLNSSGVKKLKSELIGKRIQEMPQDLRSISESLGTADSNTKTAWMKKWFNAGKDIFDTQKSVMKGTVGAMISNALAEGTEEVSEELLKDFSTSCFNLVKAAQGDKDTRMQGFLGTWDWNEALKRYGMSFFGGLVGGGINSATYDYRQFKDIANMTSEQAMQQLVWMDRNNEMDKFWDVVSKETLGDKYHTTERDENGNYKLGDATNNQDVEVKKALRSQIDLIHNILTAEGANIDDDGLIGQVMNALPSVDSREILGDFRANALATSVTAGRYLKEYNNLCKAIVLEANKLRQLQTTNKDSEKPTKEQEAAIRESQESLKTLQDARAKVLSGERTAEFYKDALFETTYGVSESFIAPTEVQYLEMLSGKPYALLTEEEKKPLREKYVNWSKTERGEQIHQLATMFYDTTARTSQALQQSSEIYDKIKEGQLKKLQEITQYSGDKLSSIMQILAYKPDDALDLIQTLISDSAMDQGRATATPVNIDPDGNIGDTLLSNVQDSLGNQDNSYVKEYTDILEDTSIDNDTKVPMLASVFINKLAVDLNKTADEVISTGYVNPEVKRNLLPVLKQTASHCADLAINLDMYADIIPDHLRDKFGEAIEKVSNIESELQEKAEAIDKLNYTPISENLRSFAIGLGTDKSILDLVEGALKKEESYQEAIENILIDEDTAKQFDEAEKLLKLYRASIVASRTDNSDVDNIFGYNKTLNELCKRDQNWTPLAEIDAQTADLALQDVNMALNRLKVIRGVSDLNQGNKLNIQNYTAANKNFILYNRMSKVLTSLLNEDDDDAKDFRANWNGVNELKTAIDGMTSHKQLTAEKLEDRTLALNTDQKEAIEREQHQMDDAIYDFFQKNQDKLADTETARKELAKFLKVAKMDFYDKNEGILTQSSENIDDSAFIWWLASKAALRGSDFYKAYRKIISDDIAPIPTQELGVYAATAAIYNGDVFRAFGNAVKQYMYDDWKATPGMIRKGGKIDPSTVKSKRLEIVQNKGLEGLLPLEEGTEDELLFSDLVPNFNNILFIEGIPGSGKSAAVLKTLSKLLNTLNPELGDGSKLLDKPIVVAHSNTENAQHLGENLGFRDGTRLTPYGKEELLTWMSAEYKNRENPDTGIFEYYDDDVMLNDKGVYVSTWKTRKLPKQDIPSTIFIDEWSRYTQPEVDLINRFASENGIQVIACGDMDQLSPKAYYFPKKGIKLKDAVQLSIARNITPRVPKLGISMRAGNGQKVENLYALQSWKRNPSSESIPLYYVETAQDIWGDKPYQVTGDLTDSQLNDMKTDIDKMVSNLNDGEKIGYIWHNKDSKLYKLLSSDPYKDKVDFKNETAAQGREARYYIVENNRDTKQDDMEYHKSLYTGISRAEQASLVVVPNESIGRLRVIRPLKQENKLIPDNFTKEGIARFSIQRKALLDKIYSGQPDADLSKIKPKTPLEIINIRKGAKKKKTPKPKKATSGTINVDTNVQGAQFQKNQIISNGINSAQILDVSVNYISNPPTVLYKVDLDGTGAKYLSEQELLDQGYQFLKAPTQPAPPTEEPVAEGHTEEIPETKEPEGTDEKEDTSNTQWDPNNDETNLKFWQGIADIAVPTSTGYLRFNKVDLENNLGVNKGDLDPLFAELATLDNSLWSEPSPGTYEIKQDIVNGILNSPAKGTTEGTDTTEVAIEPPTPKYKEGDVFKIAEGKEYKVLEFRHDDSYGNFYYLGPVSGDPTSTVWKSESDLENFESEGKFTAKEDYVTPDEGVRQQPELPETTQGRENLEQVVEEMEDALEPPVEELTITDDEDIDVPLYGHTWNTFYLGVDFDENSGEPILPQEGEPGTDRIDCAHGLVKLSPEKFNNRRSIEKTMGTIRKAMQFRNNSDIAKVLQDEIPALKDQELKIEWNFISKAIERTDDGGRFQYANTGLLHMEDSQHETIPTKTISMLVWDAQGNCVLEMPLFTLGSPFTALYKLSQLTPDNSVAVAYTTALTNKTLKPYQILQKVVAAIKTAPEAKNSKGHIKAGYKKLQDMCKLWQFTSDGIRRIPNINKTKDNKEGEPWYPAAAKKCLGPHYVKDRITEMSLQNDSNNPYDYSRVWHDMTEEGERTDVNYSDVMISLEQEDQWGHKVVAPGHPFVLRSDSNQFITNEQMMRRYLQQLNDPTLEPIVKLEILVPPETTVYDYIDRMRNALGNRYGNEFTAFRILNIVQKLDPDFYNDRLEPATRGKINPIIEALNNVQAGMQQEDGESHQEFMSRVYKAQKDILVQERAVKTLQNALFEMTYDYNGSEDNLQKIKVEDARHVQELCDQKDENGNKYMTGVLYRPICRTADEAAPVLGYGYLVKTGRNRFANEDHKSYRIYSRYDTPIFDLSDIYDSISNWANNYTVNGNIYRFSNPGGKPDYAYIYYTRGRGTKKPTEETPNQKLMKKHKDLLEKLNINNYDRLSSIEDETKFLEAIRDQYIETPGNVAAVVNGNKLIYTQINNNGVEGQGFTDELLNAVQISFEDNHDGDNTYTLKLQLQNGETSELQVTILPDTSEIEFDLGKPMVTETPVTPKASVYDFNPIIESLNSKIKDLLVEAVDHADKKKLKEQLENISKLIQKGISDGKTHAEVVQQILEAYPSKIAQRKLKKELGEEFFQAEEETSQEESQQDIEVCSIKVRKKFRK